MHNVYFSVCVFLLISPCIAQLFHFAASVSFSLVALVIILCSVAVDNSYCSLSFYVFALLTACHSVAVDVFYCCLSFFVIAELSFVKYTVQLDLNLILVSEVHACILGLVPSIFEKLACLYTTVREISVHNTLRATCTIRYEQRASRTT